MKKTVEYSRDYEYIIGKKLDYIAKQHSRDSIEIRDEEYYIHEDDNIWCKLRSECFKIGDVYLWYENGLFNIRLFKKDHEIENKKEFKYTYTRIISIETMDSTSLPKGLVNFLEQEGFTKK